MQHRLTILLLAAFSLSAADFQSGQAARAVLGQSSFTSHDPGVSATSLTMLGSRLYASDSAHRLLTFDLSKIPDSREDAAARAGNGCSVCGFMPVASVNQSVAPGAAAFAVSGKTVVLASPATHRVLIWRDATSGRIDRSPDLVLGRLSNSFDIGPTTLVNPVSVATDGKRLFVGDAALHRVLVWNTLPAAEDQPADAVLGQPDFFSALNFDTPAPDSITTPTAMAFDGANLFVADTAARRILVFSPADAVLSGDAIVNSASLAAAPLAPGTLFTVEGNNLSDDSFSAKTESVESLPKQLGGTELIFDGQPLPLLAVSPFEIQSQVPYDLGSRTAASLYVRMQHSNGIVTVTNAATVKLAIASPGIFAFDGEEPRGGIVLHTAVVDTQGGGSPVTKESPAAPGEVVTVWATGLGPLTESGDVSVPVTARIDGQPAEVLSAKLPDGAIGIYDVRIALSPRQNASSEAHLSISQSGVSSNTITFPLEHRAR